MHLGWRGNLCEEVKRWTRHPYVLDVVHALKRMAHSHRLSAQFFAARDYTYTMSLGGMNGGNAGTTSLDNRTGRYSAPRQSQSSMTTPGRTATRQCRSRVKCVAEDVVGWRCPW